MAGSERERQLARQQARRQGRRGAARHRAQRPHGRVVAGLVIVGVIGASAFALSRMGGDESATATASPRSPALAATDAATAPDAAPDHSAAPETGAAPGGCDFGRAEQPAALDVGVPAADPARARRPYTATLRTDKGPITFTALAAQAPCAALSFRHLAERGYFEGTDCHRVNSAVLQCGDPTGTGTGGPGYGFAVENPPPGNRYPPGTVAMARTSDPRRGNGSQFFIVHDEYVPPAGAGAYTVFGRVTDGLDVVRAVATAGVQGGGEDGRPVRAPRIEQVLVREGTAR